MGHKSEIQDKSEIHDKSEIQYKSETELEYEMKHEMGIEMDIEIDLNKMVYDKLIKGKREYKNFNPYEQYYIYNINEYNYNASYIQSIDDDIVRRNLTNFICLYEQVYLYNTVIIGYKSINDHNCYFYSVKEYISPNYIKLEESSNFLFYSDKLISVIEFLVDSHKLLMLKELNSIDSIDFNKLSI